MEGVVGPIGLFVVGTAHFDRSPPGRVTVTDAGATVFTPDVAGKHRYLVLHDAAARSRVIEALVQLTSRPPCR